MAVIFLVSVFVGYFLFNIFWKKEKKYKIKIGDKVILKQNVAVAPTNIIKQGRIGKALDKAYTNYFLIDFEGKRYWIHEERLGNLE